MNKCLQTIWQALCFNGWKPRGECANVFDGECLLNLPLSPSRNKWEGGQKLFKMICNLKAIG